jgi:hypothetical protein
MNYQYPPPNPKYNMYQHSQPKIVIQSVGSCFPGITVAPGPNLKCKNCGSYSGGYDVCSNQCAIMFLNKQQMHTHFTPAPNMHTVCTRCELRLAAPGYNLCPHCSNKPVNNNQFNSFSYGDSGTCKHCKSNSARPGNPFCSNQCETTYKLI